MSKTKNSVQACTSIVLWTKDGDPVYGRTNEWGAFDVKSNLVLTPRGFSQTSFLSDSIKGMTWKSKYGFVAINSLDLPFYLDGMNETGLAAGALYLPGFTKYQEFEEGKEALAVTNIDFIAYLLGNFETTEEIKDALPKIQVVENKDAVKKTGSPMPLHYVVTDSQGKSIVIEYVEGCLNIHENKVGVMTNSPTYDWHLLNIRNYTHLAPYAKGPGEGGGKGVNFSPLSSGAGMTGLPGDSSSASRFVRAFAYTQTSKSLDNSGMAINQASHILNNFDIPDGFERVGSEDDYYIGRTQWSTVGDIKNKRYYWWTEFNRQMRMVDLAKLSFDGDKTVAFSLDKDPLESVDDRTADFSQ